LYRTEIT